MKFGFIVTRHVNSIETNKYWNHGIKLLKMFYPLATIIIIDDGSDPSFLKADKDLDYSNIEIIQSEYIGRGELLPYIYFLRNPQWFENAVILHDSVFIHKRIAFEKLQKPVAPLWFFPYDKENIHNILRICSGLKNNYTLMHKLTQNQPTVLGMHSPDDFVCCFGAQSFINYHFLNKIEEKYGISNLVYYVKSRMDRCALERIMGLLFTIEYPALMNYKSLLGNIQVVGNWGYSFEKYQTQLYNKKRVKSVVKVWTGR